MSDRQLTAALGPDFVHSRDMEDESNGIQTLWLEVGSSLIPKIGGPQPCEQPATCLSEHHNESASPAQDEYLLHVPSGIVNTGQLV